MSTNFPTSKDTLTNPSGTDVMADVSHSSQHANANDAIEAIQTKVGVDSSTDATSIDYKLTNASSSNPGHKHTAAAVSDFDTEVSNNTDVAANTSARHNQQHSITSASDHTSTATAGQMLKADANGLPVDATNTDAQVAQAVTDSGTAVQPGDLATVATSGDHVDLANKGTNTHAQIDTAVTNSANHIASNGSDHSYIDQDVTSGSSPTFDGANFSGIDMSKALTVESPAADEDISMFFTEDAVTITKMAAVLTGSSTPSVTWTVRHSTDRSAAGNEVVTSGTTTTSTTTGSIVTSFNDATIPANSFVWFETTAQSGTVDSINLTIIYDKD